nr:autotransporter-associated beta strand repeat-containing protein [Akkermansiaceae bacterium]
TNAGTGYTGTPTYTFASGDAVPGSLTISSVTLAADSSIGGPGNTTINAEVLQTGGTRALTKVGAGTVTLSGTKSYAGTTTIAGGTLDITSGNSAAGTYSLSGSGNPVLKLSHVNALATTALIAGTSSTANIGTLDLAAAGDYTLGTFNRGHVRFSASSGENTTLTFTNNSTVSNGADGARTLTNSSSNLHVIFAGDLDISSSTAAGVTFAGAGSTTVNGAIFNGSGQTRTLTKSNSGTLTLKGANTYSGTTTVSGGTLKLGANDVIPDTSNVSIGPATLDADTRTDIAGTLDVTGAAVINLGSGAALAFADSKAVDWTGGTLNITGTLGATSLRFGDSADDLTSGPDSQLAKISVNGSGLGTYILDANGYLVPGSGGSPYDAWATSKGLTGAPGSSTDPAKSADPDKDGSSNLAEFAFNGNPLSGSDNGKVFMLTEDSVSDVDAVKELILTAAVRTGTPVFAGSPAPSATQAADGITYSIEGSLDLASFLTTVNVVLPTPVVPVSLPAAGAGYEYRSFSLQGSNGLTGKGFLRAKVISP